MRTGRNCSMKRSRCAWRRKLSLLSHSSHWARRSCQRNMRSLVIGSLLVLSTTSALAEYREAWVSPGELKQLEVEHKSAHGKAPLEVSLKPESVSSHARDPQGRASVRSSSDPIAAFAREDGGAIVPRKSRTTPALPHKATVVRKKVSEHIGNLHRVKTAASSMV